MRSSFRILILGFAMFAHCALAADATRNLSVSTVDTPANDRRIALVIGNSAYKSSPLVNPVNDARAISAKLRALGFTVIERENLMFKEIGSTLREFRSKLAPGGVALFFYAGHGMQVQGVNYLPVVDADIASEEDVSLQSLEVGKVLSLMDDAKTRLNLVFLDACRNNPFARSFRSAADGLARVSAPTGTLISFATRPGSVAADGTGRNGLYTEQLLSAMDLRGQPIELALKRVVSGVKAASKGRQEPWMEGSIEGDFCFGGCATSIVPVSPTAPSATDESINDRTYWESIKDSRSPDELSAYLAEYPNGRFASLANARLRALKEAPAADGDAQQRKAASDTSRQATVIFLRGSALLSSGVDATVLHQERIAGILSSGTFFRYQSAPGDQTFYVNQFPVKIALEANKTYFIEVTAHAFGNFSASLLGSEGGDAAIRSLKDATIGRLNPLTKDAH